MESRKMLLMKLVKNGLVDTIGEGEGGMKGKGSADIETLRFARQLVGS